MNTTEGQKPYGRLRYKRKDNTEVNPKGTGNEDTN
jgi:hypothetical protein